MDPIERERLLQAAALVGLGEQAASQLDGASQPSSSRNEDAENTEEGRGFDPFALEDADTNATGGTPPDRASGSLQYQLRRKQAFLEWNQHFNETATIYMAISEATAHWTRRAAVQPYHCPCENPQSRVRELIMVDVWNKPNCVCFDLS